MNLPSVEAIKEVARWVVLFIVSWIISETVKQLHLVPEMFSIKLWVFVYAIPVRTLMLFGLTFVGRYVDKYMHESSKLEIRLTDDEDHKPSGLLPF